MSQEHKFPRGVSARPGQPKPLQRLEWLTVFHVALLVIAASWMLGGNTPWARTVLSWWGSLGLLITLAVLADPVARENGQLRPLWWLWPLALFDLLVLASALNPSFREVMDGANQLYVQNRGTSSFPSTARPGLTLRTLWFFNAVYLACFNLVLVIRQRRAFRLLLLVLLGNAVLLAVFGTLQKLLGATGLFFGWIKSPQLFFFSSFIYHNHWGAFTVLMTGIGLALVFHYARRSESRDFWHSPAFGGLVAILLLAASIPLSTSRSCTLLVVLLLTGAFLHWLIRLMRKRRSFRESSVVPLGGAVLALLLAGGFAYNLSRDVIKVRVNHTRQQFADMRARGEYLPRATLYRDTWKMAREKLWFGWGMASYPTVFFDRNSQKRSPVDGLPISFHDAHSDWLQSVSEVGLVGTSLLGLCGAVPLYLRRRALRASPLPAYLLSGCGLILLYAWIEFPFGNRAVIVAFWVCLFTAAHYGRCESTSETAG